MSRLTDEIHYCLVTGSWLDVSAEVATTWAFRPSECGEIQGGVPNHRRFPCNQLGENQQFSDKLNHSVVFFPTISQNNPQIPIKWWVLYPISNIFIISAA